MGGEDSEFKTACRACLEGCGLYWSFAVHGTTWGFCHGGNLQDSSKQCKGILTGPTGFDLLNSQLTT